nr:hypothetical protein [Tanacetum cinerariifolium]
MKEKHLDNIKKYQSLKRKSISIAQARKNMIVYLKNMAGYKMEHYVGMTYDKVRPIFEREYNKVQTLFKPDKDEEPTNKRVAEEILLQESFKKLKIIGVSGFESIQDTSTVDHKEMSKEDVKNMLEIFPLSEFKIEALQVKYLLIDWEIHFEGSRTYWKIIRVGGITQAYQLGLDLSKLAIILNWLKKIHSKGLIGITVATTPQISKDDVTLAQTLMEIKAAKPKAKGVTIQEPSEFRITSPPQAKDKGKGIMVEPEKPLKKKDQIVLHKEATIDADRQLAKQIQAREREREQLSIEERSKLLAELIESRRKYFAAKRAEEIKNKPPTKAQQKSLMCSYMKYTKGFKQKDFKGKRFDDIKKMFDKVYKRVNTFMDMNTENVEESLNKTQAKVTKGSSKRAGQELEQESAKKQKLDE